jgi:LuxR family transcriptional regulator, quorum-sensing system regulator CciR
MLVLNSAQDVANLIASAKTFDDLNEALGAASNEMGFQLYALMRHPRSIDAKVSPIRLHNYAREWQEIYDRRQLGLCDPIHRASQRVADGFRWRDVRDHVPMRDDDEWMLEEAHNHDIGDGYTVAVNVPGEAPGSVTFVTRVGRPFPDQMLLYALSLGAMAYQQARVITGVARPPQRRLVTDRHAQVIKWMGRNKTDAETGTILGISGATVTKHVRDICERFDTYKRTALPLRAVSEGILCFEDFYD